MVTGDSVRRILIVDPRESAGADLRKILTAHSLEHSLTTMDATSSSHAEHASRSPDVQFDLAAHSTRAVEMVLQGRLLNSPIAVAFVVWEVDSAEHGLDLVSRLLAADRTLQIVLCVSSYSESCQPDLRAWAASGRVLLLKRPREVTEAWLLTTFLLEKWRITQFSQERERQAASPGNDAQIGRAHV